MKWRARGSRVVLYNRAANREVGATGERCLGAVRLFCDAGKERTGKDDGDYFPG